MEQLIMRWKYTDGAKAPEVKLPEGFTVRSHDGSFEDVDRWLDIVQYGLTNGRCSRELFESCMLGHKNIEYEKIFFIEKEGESAATITVICDNEASEGYIHMVACHEKYRGLGLGTAMNALAVKTLINSGMKTAYLTTDDFRIPAIKSYLRAGFVPDISTEDFKERWEKIYEKIG